MGAQEAGIETSLDAAGVGACATTLFHVSEEPGLRVFQPRTGRAERPDEALVWAIDEAHLLNYLLPRECPRVTFAAAAHTSPEDRARFFPVRVSRVVAIEGGWLARAVEAVLYVYSFPAENFALLDAGAGYWVSTKQVESSNVAEIVGGLQEIVRRGAEFRMLESLWPLHDAVKDSTLEFSMIRMRNAQERL